MVVSLKKSIVSLVLVLSFSFSSISSAENDEMKLSDKLSGMTFEVTISGCDDDAKKYCDGLDRESNKVMLCLTAYEDKLSQQCKQNIIEAAMAMGMGAAAIEYSASTCEADADKYCLDVMPGEGRLVGCIKANEAKVSEACKTALKETGLWEIGK